MSLLPESYQRLTVKFPPSPPWNIWVLDSHYKDGAGANGRQRTYLGELTYQAKYNGHRHSMNLLCDVIRHSVLQLRQLPQQTDALAMVTSVAAVPCNPPKTLSVPHYAAAAAATALGVPDISNYVVKPNKTAQAKIAVGPRAPNPGAYAVTRSLEGHTVLLIDDLYLTGATLESVAANLRKVGAAHVVGLCITKAHKGMN
jgi:predicted amidophosphoribosyltransferase